MRQARTYISKIKNDFTFIIRHDWDFVHIFFEKIFWNIFWDACKTPANRVVQNVGT
jgi:hypothetical protein